MHESSRIRMERFAEMCGRIYGRNAPISIADIGGVGNSYRGEFAKYLPNCRYVTVNARLGMRSHEKSCEILLDDVWNWREIEDNSFDVVISGQTFEHIEYPFITILQMRRILKVGGWLCIIAPSHWPEHPAPLDTYRYYRDGMNALAKYAGLTILYSGADHPLKASSYNDLRGDAYVIAQKPETTPDQNRLYQAALESACAIVPAPGPREISRFCKYWQTSHAYEIERGIGPEYNILSGNFTGEYSLHTRGGQNEAIIIDVGSIMPLHSLKIFNRKNMENRTEQLAIYRSNDMRSWDCIVSNTGRFGGIYDASPLEVAINAKARYLMLQLPVPEFLHLDQIQVFAS